MKSKQYVEALRAQMDSSLKLLAAKLGQAFTLEENDKINVADGEYAYGIQITQVTPEGKERRIWLRRYPLKGSLNDIKAGAYSELFDIIIGSFLVNAIRSDDATLEKLSNDK